MAGVKELLSVGGKVGEATEGLQGGVWGVVSALYLDCINVNIPAVIGKL